METRILEFTRTRGLPASLVPELLALFSELGGSSPSGSLSNAVDQSLPDRTPVDLGGEPSSRPTVAPEQRIAGRFEDLGLLGTGGMGEVRRVRDVELNRTLAMKMLHGSLTSKPGAMARFLDEAQTSAQLQHQNIVPVHDVGALPDGRLWFTMREVHGRTLSEVVKELHAASTHEWMRGEHGWTFRRLMDAYLSVCRAVAYAHERGVVHRDLKPNNVMIGTLGEVYVLDWGLAKVLGRAEHVAEGREVDVVQTARTLGSSDAYDTAMGRVVGTPAYMPPEQARGEVDRIDARSDVYALGAMLYEILSGHPPYEGSRADAVLLQVLAGPPPEVGQARSTTLGFDSFLGESPRRAGPPLPPELVAICERAMEREAAHRYGSALELAAEVEAWVRASWEGRVSRDLGPAAVSSHPVDVSPYGARGLGGNVMDWCLDTEGRVVDQVVVEPEAGDTDLRALRAVRGGAWPADSRVARSAVRNRNDPGIRDPIHGLRGGFRPSEPRGPGRGR